MWLCAGVLLAHCPSPLGGGGVLLVHSMQVRHISQMLGVPFGMVDTKRGEHNTLGGRFYA